MLKPYYIKTDEKYVRIILAYQYFSIDVKGKVYQFIPVEANEIKVNRQTKKIENIHAKFAFQHEKDVVYVTMAKLVTLPDFLKQLHSITASYFYENSTNSIIVKEIESAVIIGKLEKDNLKRLIDKALDEKDEKLFYELTELL